MSDNDDNCIVSPSSNDEGDDDGVLELDAVVDTVTGLDSDESDEDGSKSNETHSETRQSSPSTTSSHALPDSPNHSEHSNSTNRRSSIASVGEDFLLEFSASADHDLSNLLDQVEADTELMTRDVKVQVGVTPLDIFTANIQSYILKAVAAIQSLNELQKSCDAVVQSIYSEMEARSKREACVQQLRDPVRNVAGHCSAVAAAGGDICAALPTDGINRFAGRIVRDLLTDFEASWMSSTKVVQSDVTAFTSSLANDNKLFKKSCAEICSYRSRIGQCRAKLLAFKSKLERCLE